jgi:hypothetical protein
LKVERSIAAFVLSLIGGVIIALIGAFSLSEFLVDVPLIARYRPIEVVEMIGCTIGPVSGALIILGAVMLYWKPAKHTVSSIIIIVFSFLSWIGTVGGFMIGFILAFIGGVLGLAKRTGALPQTPPQESLVGAVGVRRKLDLGHIGFLVGSIIAVSAGILLINIRVFEFLVAFMLFLLGAGGIVVSLLLEYLDRKELAMTAQEANLALSKRILGVSVVLYCLQGILILAETIRVISTPSPSGMHACSRWGSTV